jgi:hypothetical protein
MIYKNVRSHVIINNIPQMKYDKEKDLNNWVEGALYFFFILLLPDMPRK